MNERIKELLEQAKTQVDHSEGCYPATTVRYDVLEKFAILIVQECINLSKGRRRAWFKQHFGIEE